jgi:hypothetical protein
MLPHFQVLGIRSNPEITIVSGSFSRAESLAAGDRGWLFVSGQASIADIVRIEGADADLDVPDWSMTDHVRTGAVLPWLDAFWQAGDVAFLLDHCREWRRVMYTATDAVVFAERVVRCNECRWTGGADDPTRRACPLCSGELKETEIFGNQEAVFPLRPDQRFVETRAGGWNHDHCLICNVAIGRAVPRGYRDSSFVGPNSAGMWLCEQCFERYVRRGDFSFLVRSSASS